MEAQKKSNETRIKFVAFLVFLFFLLAAYSLSAQMNLKRDKGFVYIQKGDYYVERTIIMPNEPMFFNYNISTNEYLTIGIASDSISFKTFRSRIYAYLPTSINVKSTNLIITFDDGSQTLFPINRVDEDNYVEFSVNEDNYKILMSKKAISFNFHGIGKFSNDSDKLYFVKFFNALVSI